jgi:hypothetical protein
MKRVWFASAAMLLLTMLSPSRQARPFIDPRSERNDAIDQAAATESRDHACDARISLSHSLGHFRTLALQNAAQILGLGPQQTLRLAQFVARIDPDDRACLKAHRPFSAEQKITSLR